MDKMTQQEQEKCKEYIKEFKNTKTEQEATLLRNLNGIKIHQKIEMKLVI